VRGLPWWFWLGVGIVKYWYITIPLAITLAWAAWHGETSLGGIRWVLIAAVVFLTLPFPAGALIVLYQSYDATRFWRTLDTAETISDLPLPTGSKVQFADKAHTIVVSIELPHATEILGMRLTGTLTPWKRQGNAVTHWGGDLHGYQIIDGLPCRGGPYPNDKSGGVVFDSTGKIHRFTLGAPHELLGLKLSPFTTVWRVTRKSPGVSCYRRPALTYQCWTRWPQAASPSTSPTTDNWCASVPAMARQSSCAACP